MVPLCLVKEMPGVNKLLMIWAPEWRILSNILWIEIRCGSRKLLVGGGIMVPLCLVKEMPGVNQLLMIWERLLRNFYGDTMVVVEEGLYQFLLMVT